MVHGYDECGITELKMLEARYNTSMRSGVLNSIGMVPTSRKLGKHFKSNPDDSSNNIIESFSLLPLSSGNAFMSISILSTNVDETEIIVKYGQFKARIIPNRLKTSYEI